MGTFLIYAMALVVTIYALIDCIMTPHAQARGLPKVLWLVLVVILPVAGAVAWLLLGRPPSTRFHRGTGDGAGGNGGGGGGPERPVGPRLPGRPGRRRGPVAPDDDPAFLRRLDEQAWQAKMRRRRSDPGSGTDEEHPSSYRTGSVRA